MIKGSCLCGRVTFEVSMPPERMNICHCTMCRKASGSAYGVFAHMRTTGFRWTSSTGSVRAYESSPGHARVFCSTCGSPLPNVGPDHTCIPAGVFDTDPHVRPMLQIFAGSKAPWHELAEEPVSYEAFDPD